MILEVPNNFDFPFPPYAIQHEFMSNLYGAIENSKLGIFESPTGTGKSLSIICGALQWLKDHNKRERDDILSEMQSLQSALEKLVPDTTDWITTQAQEIVLNRKLNELRRNHQLIEEYDKKIEKLRENRKTKKELKRNKFFQPEAVEDDMLLEEVSDKIEEEHEENDTVKYVPVKIFICSRTHSQLSQLVGEIIKSPFGRDSRAVSLASRQSYCINPSVTKLKNLSLINEKCLDMHNKSKNNTKTGTDGKVLKKQKGSCQCPYKKEQNIDDLMNLSLLEIQDVEDLVTKAKNLNACPYYASRKAVGDAQIVLVPYNTLLHKTTREASGINLKNNVVIIDEAHNLLEALSQIYSTEINYQQLKETEQRLKNYKQKYSKRFSAFNLLCINQLLFIVSNLLRLLDKSSTGNNSCVYTIEDFVLTAEFDNLNLFKLLKFCRDSRISNKLHSFSLKYPLETTLKDTKSSRTKVQEFLSSIENQNKNIVPEAIANDNIAKPTTHSGNPFLTFVSFMEVLTYSYEDGRIVLYRGDEKKPKKLHFLLLNPAKQFKDVVEEARAVIVAGGTMKPMSEFRSRLFIGAGADSNRIMEFSCDHIIPQENILPLVITKGQNSENLLFNFENRSSMGPILKQMLQEVSKNVKGGIVVFFSSYKYESWVYQQLKDVKFDKIVFREPQDTGSVDSVLDAYAAAIRKPDSTGAILFSVVGMFFLCEGLNFSDDLGRCVIVVGLPYANIYSPELKEKMTYLDKTEGKGAGQQFYEAICMKAVNQCIGRAVRHKNDYACVLLLDIRYDRSMVKNSLPGWIKRSLLTSTFSDGMNLMKNFFLQKNKD
ncbi:hypothetical protein FQA39_LY00492 [Lamprigera yunnana]|nr:hypothetical protein FQA39_LY00492 [Lamprigera yunnana]